MRDYDSQAATDVKDGDGDISLMALLTVLGRRKWTLVKFIFFGGVLSVGLALALPRKYTASTLVLPPQQQGNSSSGALAQINALVGLAGGGAVGSSDSGDLFVALVDSRAVRDALIAQFDLKAHYGVETLTSARSALKEAVSATTDKKSGLIQIEVDDIDPAMAAKLANAYVDNLRNVLSKFAVTEAQRRRAFFEEQLNKSVAQLSDAEFAFRRAQAQSGVVVGEALAQSSMTVAQELRAEIARKEVQILALGRFATNENAELRQLSAEVAALKSKLVSVESGEELRSGADSNKGIATLNAYRAFKTRQAAVEAVTRQYELAKMDEAREGPLLQQVDPAVIPETPSKPGRFRIVWLGTLAFAFLGVVWCLLDFARQSDGAFKRRFDDLRAAWR